VQTSLNRLLIAIAVMIVTIDVVWLQFGHFTIDAHPYLLLALIVPLCGVGASYYGRLRNEACLSAMFSATAFLLIVPAASCLLSYLAVTVAGPRIDSLLAAFDQALGVSWPAIMGFAADHPLLTQTLSLAYDSIIAQTLLLVLLLGLCRQELQLYGLCLAIAVGAVITIAVWTAFPSFGAYSVYHLSPAVTAKLHLVEGLDYGQQLSLLLKNGPGLISPHDLRGIIGFPSYHTVQAIVLAWYARKLPYVSWVFLGLNILVVAATPVHGGHHIVDILGGCAVAGAAIVAAEATIRKFCVHVSAGFARVPLVQQGLAAQ